MLRQLIINMNLIKKNEILSLITNAVCEKCYLLWKMLSLMKNALFYEKCYLLWKMLSHAENKIAFIDLAGGSTYLS